MQVWWSQTRIRFHRTCKLKAHSLSHLEPQSEESAVGNPRWLVDLDSCTLIYLEEKKKRCFSLNEEPESDLKCLVKFALFGGWKVDTDGYLEAWPIGWFSWILEEGDLSARPKDNKDPSPSFPIRDQAAALKRWIKQVRAGLQKDFKDWPHSLREPFCWFEEVKS